MDRKARHQLARRPSGTHLLCAASLAVVGCHCHVTACAPILMHGPSCACRPWVLPHGLPLLHAPCRCARSRAASVSACRSWQPCWSLVQWSMLLALVLLACRAPIHSMPWQLRHRNAMLIPASSHSRPCRPAEGADPSKVSDRAKKRGLVQLGSLGSGNHYTEIQVGRHGPC